MFHVIIKQTETTAIKLSTFNTCRSVYFGYTSIKLETSEKESWPVSYHLKSVLLAYSSGKAGFNEKIQLGSKFKETQSMLRKKKRPSQASPCRAANQGTLKNDH